MQYRRLGRTGLMVSELCLGCMTFGWELDEEGSRGIVARFLEAGGNFIDTADVYGGSGNDQIESDVLETPGSTDHSYGGGGNDQVTANDGNKAIINCGKGNDFVRYDAGLDEVKSCETKVPV